ncbi:hypothetical protein C7M84_013083 [Penaeus vannamei]|uniref:Uncharacterized protein n=1 Tax=Penaeus vannamei TaxID=6689 RepID=A0A3R7M0Y5_PENVA|nr:hypothetical protein C7M84_013083 [Penaeus vannamei]
MLRFRTPIESHSNPPPPAPPHPSNPPIESHSNPPPPSSSPPPSDWQRCCGSEVPYTTGRETGHLSRTVTVGLVDIVGGGKNLSHVPPSRISDFRAEINPASQQITFTWTSPGEWRDYGTVRGGLLRDAAATGRGVGEFAREWPSPKPAGEVSSHVARWGRHDGVYYAAIRGESRMGAKGPWSNTAEFFMPHPPTTTEINTRGSTQGGPMGGSVSELGVTTPQPGTLSTRDILAIVGAGCGLLVVVLILAVYYLLVVTRRRRHHQEKKAVEVLEPSWPASTLLAEHERRHAGEPADGDAAELALHRPDLGVPYMPTMQPAHPHPFYYHTPNGHYIEDSLAMDSGSVVSSQPSDSLLAYKVDSAAPDALRPPASSATPTPAAWESARRQGPMKVPPPTPPKPTLAAHLTLGGVAATPLGTERKRRNVTQV